MDTLAHGLWGGAVFGQEERSQYKWAFLLGMCPDLFSFGPFFLTRLGDIGERLARHSGPPDPSTIPAYVYHAYDLTHSLVIFAIVWGLLWKFKKSFSWPFLAWGLHILCDIPTHSTRFFPTPYLWPLPTPFYNGTPWGNRMFMIANYSGILLTYLILFWRKRTAHRPIN